MTPQRLSSPNVQKTGFTGQRDLGRGLLSLVEFAYATPLSHKIPTPGTGKRLLRDAAWLASDTHAHTASGPGPAIEWISAS